jgi:hypothetical protein
MDMADDAAMNGVYVEDSKVNPPARIEITRGGRIHAR